jgi:hypothetical protein
MQTIYHRFAQDYRERYRVAFGHLAPISCTDYDIVDLYEAARRNPRNYSDAARCDEVLLHMLYWVNPKGYEYPRDRVRSITLGSN